MSLFGNIKYQANINNNANFASFPTAMLLLFRFGYRIVRKTMLRNT